MTMSKDFILFSAQCVVYLAEENIFSQPKFIASILSSYADLYNGSVETLPSDLLIDAPPEIPRVVLQSDDGQWRIQASGRRIDALWNIIDINSIQENAVSMCSDVIKHYIDSISDVRISRLALVVRHIRLVDNPSDFLLQHMINKDFSETTFVETETLEVNHFRKDRLPSTDILINKWTRYKSINVQPMNIPAIAIEQDLNTPEDEENKYSADAIEQFYRDTDKYAHDFLEKIFSERR